MRIWPSAQSAATSRRHQARRGTEVAEDAQRLLREAGYDPEEKE